LGGTLGAIVERLDADDVDLQVIGQSDGMMRSRAGCEQGGCTEVDADGIRGGNGDSCQDSRPASFDIVINFNLYLADQYTTRSFGMPSALEHLISHEMGHAYFRVVSDPEDRNRAANNTFAVDVENMFRGPTAQRPRH
jgi:hypothetical protein